MAINPNVRYTYDDYINLDDSPDKQYELINGDIYMVPSPVPRHQNIVFTLATLLSTFVKARNLGTIYIAPLDVVLSNEDVLQPDIMFISNDRQDIIKEQNIRGAPDLVIEVLSPGTSERDRTIKRSRYARFGVREYWMVEPSSKTIEVQQASQQGFETVRVYSEGLTLESPLLTELNLSVSDVFA